MGEEISATLEHRLTLLEGAITAGFELQAAETRTLAIEVSGMKAQVTTQNGRVASLEKWREFLTGLREGRASIGNAQLAFLGIVGPLLFTGINLAFKIWG